MKDKKIRELEIQSNEVKIENEYLKEKNKDLQKWLSLMLNNVTN